MGPSVLTVNPRSPGSSAMNAVDPPVVVLGIYAAPIPAPTTALPCGTGVAGWAALGRRKQKMITINLQPEPCLMARDLSLRST